MKKYIITEDQLSQMVNIMLKVEDTHIENTSSILDLGLGKSLIKEIANMGNAVAGLFGARGMLEELKELDYNRDKEAKVTEILGETLYSQLRDKYSDLLNNMKPSNIQKVVSALVSFTEHKVEFDLYTNGHIRIYHMRHGMIDYYATKGKFSGNMIDGGVGFDNLVSCFNEYSK